MVGYVEDCLQGGNLIEEIGLHPNTAGERGLKPVSYTHLDVYKRQPRVVYALTQHGIFRSPVDLSLIHISQFGW